MFKGVPELPNPLFSYGLYACSLSVGDFDVELIHPSMFLVLASAGKIPLLRDVLIFTYNFGEFFLQPCKIGT